MFQDQDACPCESGLLVRDCSCKTHGFVPHMANTIPPGPITGIRRPGCYAAPLGDCKYSLSAEHPLSQTVIEQIAGFSKVINVSGSSWCGDWRAFKRIGIPNLTKRVLCRRHNSALSCLDDIAGRFLRAYSDALIHLHRGTSEDYHRLFNGFDLERWMLKVLCAHQFGQAVRGSIDNSAWQVPPEWLEILFGNVRFLPGTGLYVPKHPFVQPGFEFRISVEGLYVEHGRVDPTGIPIIGLSPVKKIAGIRIILLGFELNLFMLKPSCSDDYIYRPRMHRFRDRYFRRTAYLHVAWDESPPNFRAEVASRTGRYFAENGLRQIMVRKEGLAKKKEDRKRARHGYKVRS